MKVKNPHTVPTGIVRPFLLGLMLLSPSLAATAAQPQPDFYLRFDECKVIAASLIAPGPVKDATGAAPVLACSRNGSKVACVIEVGTERKNLDLEVDFDAPPLFGLRSAYFADHIMIDSSKHVAAYNSRILERSYYGLKLCSGFFATRFEIEATKNGME